MTLAVILKSKFVMPSSAEYKKYVDYIDLPTRSTN